jgi:hypothetical protein
MYSINFEYSRRQGKKKGVEAGALEPLNFSFRCLIQNDATLNTGKMGSMQSSVLHKRK